MRLSVLLLCVVLVCSTLGNTYQSCSTCGSPYYNYWESPNCVDASTLTKPSNDYYSYPFNSTAIFYFNFCAGIDICNGAMACVKPTGSNTPIIYVHADDNPYYYDNYYWSNGQNRESINMQWSNYNGPESHYVSYRVYCDPSTQFQVTSAYLDDDDAELTIYSSQICNQTTAPTYVAPKNFANLSGNIFLAGLIPMFSMDKASGENSNFEGRFYYSQQYNSMKINGTLTSNSGVSSKVAYLFSGTQGDDNPAVMLSYVTLPSKSSPQCVLLPNTFDDDDSDVNIFSPSKNRYYLGTRDYTSIYFQKGSVFPVNTYSHASSGSDPYLTLYTRQSDGMPYFIGGNLLAPFIGDYEFPTFISEFDVNTVSTATLPKSTFDIPPVWECQQ